MGDHSVPSIPKKRIKRAVSGLVLRILGKAFKALSKWENGVHKETQGWPEGITITFAASPEGPWMSLSKKDDTLHYHGGVKTASPDILIQFKSIDAAFIVLTGRLSIHDAYARHMFTLKGDIFFAMSPVRCMYLIEGALFPYFIFKKIFKRRPEKISKFRAYTGVLSSAKD